MSCVTHSVGFLPSGNLIRTRDGRIAVLDYGLMTEVTEVQRVALVGYIAHICTEDWEGAAMDLQVLGERGYKSQELRLQGYA